MWDLTLAEESVRQNIWGRLFKWQKLQDTWYITHRKTPKLHLRPQYQKTSNMLLMQPFNYQHAWAPKNKNVVIHKHLPTSWFIHLDTFHLKLTEARFSKRTSRIQVLKISCIVLPNPQHNFKKKSTQNSTKYQGQEYWPRPKLNQILAVSSPTLPPTVMSDQ